MVFAILVIGGITRLTGSGLSITEWEPLRGIIPPLSEADWQRYFDAYRQSPEYQHLNRGMSLEEFRGIFWWEYIHRMVARIFGVLLLVPLAYFAIRRWLRGVELLKGLGLVVLTAGQALLGWAMVRTGLGEVPYVSHLHLAAHLGLAMLLFGAMWWWALGLLDETSAPCGVDCSAPTIGGAAGVFAALVFLQSIWGALVAGLGAGRIATAFPKMGDYWIHPAVATHSPVWADLVSNPFTVQLVHRTLGIALVLFAVALWLGSRISRFCRRIERAVAVLCTVALLQTTLGVATLVYAVPTLLGVVHQAGGLILFAAALWVVRAAK